MKKDIEKTIHYTTHAEEICGNLKKYIPEDVLLIEPFVGDGDLLSLFPKGNWETYDINPKKYGKQRDSLLNPPNYKYKWIITNPPYLAKNKAKDKTIFNQYKVDDLYKATILSILDCEGGILIIPTNFLTDERTDDIRKRFFEKFTISRANVFTKPVFETTTYSVCSFAFRRRPPLMKNERFVVKVDGDNIPIILSPEYGYRVGGEFFNELEKTKSIFGRLTNTTKDFITDIKLYALDTRDKRIRLEYETEHYIGSTTDRIYATLTCKKELSQEQQKELIKRFNNELEEFRNKYHDLPMTNYRDYNRKRIGFTFAYKLLTKIYNEM